MIIVKVEEHSAVDGAFAHEIARMVLFEGWDEKTRKSVIEAAVLRGNGVAELKRAMLANRAYRRKRFDTKYLSSSRPIWYVIARALQELGFEADRYRK